MNSQNPVEIHETQIYEALKEVYDPEIPTGF